MKTDTELVAADLSTLSNHDLLAGGLDDELRMNFYAAQRLARLEEYRRRMEARCQGAQGGRAPLHDDADPGDGGRSR